MKKKTKETNGGNLITNYCQMYPKDKPQNSQKTKKNHKQMTKDIDFHESSMEAEGECSKTEVLQPAMEQEWIEQRPQEICLQMIMIAPYDTTYYKGFKRRVKDLRNSYSKDAVIKFILQNAKYEGVTNLKNLQKIDDAEFWNRTLPTLLQYVEDDRKQKSISCNIRMLIPDKNITSHISKAQILITISNMFFCIMPKQTNRKTSHYNLLHLLSVHQKDTQTTSSIKLQKLKCIINYLKIMAKRKYRDLEAAKIQYQRCVSQINQAQFRNVEYRMRDVEVRVGLVEDSYQYDLMIDFANKNIGGGVLNRGAVQEEILFCVFPELLFTLAICYQMRDNESIIVYGAEKFNLYSGYSDTFKFMGTFEQSESQIGPFKSIMIAVDAFDFNTECKSSNQYQSYYITRELTKFLGGILAVDYGADERMRVCTGKWGCGAFGGDFYLKFIIQWIACSIANKDMIFMCQNQEKKQLEIMANFLKRFDSLELLQIIEEYNYYEDSNKELIFLDFIKKYCA